MTYNDNDNENYNVVVWKTYFISCASFLWEPLHLASGGKSEIHCYFENTSGQNVEL